jgi:hypothetical protein
MYGLIAWVPKFISGFTNSRHGAEKAAAFLTHKTFPVSKTTSSGMPLSPKKPFAYKDDRYYSFAFGALP